MAKHLTNSQFSPASILAASGLVFHFLCADPVEVVAAKVNQIFCAVAGNLFAATPQIALGLLQHFQDFALGPGHLFACVKVAADAWALAQLLFGIS